LRTAAAAPVRAASGDAIGSAGQLRDSAFKYVTAISRPWVSPTYMPVSPLVNTHTSKPAMHVVSGVPSHKNIIVKQL
jgi:hypothetical protein